ncbi:MAG: hypothetical protein ABI693_02605 [Bryobacteraceae bacterium]
MAPASRPVEKRVSNYFDVDDVEKSFFGQDHWVITPKLAVSASRLYPRNRSRVISRRAAWCGARKVRVTYLRNYNDGLVRTAAVPLSRDERVAGLRGNPVSQPVSNVLLTRLALVKGFPGYKAVRGAPVPVGYFLGRRFTVHFDFLL